MHIKEQDKNKVIFIKHNNWQLEEKIGKKKKGKEMRERKKNKKNRRGRGMADGEGYGRRENESIGWLGTMMKISIIMNISVFRFYRYIDGYFEKKYLLM